MFFFVYITNYDIFILSMYRYIFHYLSFYYNFYGYRFIFTIMQNKIIFIFAINLIRFIKYNPNLGLQYFKHNF